MCPSKQVAAGPRSLNRVQTPELFAPELDSPLPVYIALLCTLLSQQQTLLKKKLFTEEPQMVWYYGLLNHAACESLATFSNQHSSLNEQAHPSTGPRCWLAPPAW